MGLHIVPPREANVLGLPSVRGKFAHPESPGKSFGHLQLKETGTIPYSGYITMRINGSYYSSFSCRADKGWILYEILEHILVNQSSHLIQFFIVFFSIYELNEKYLYINSKS